MSYDSAPSTPQNTVKQNGYLPGPNGSNIRSSRLDRGSSVDVDNMTVRADSVESGLSVYDEVQMMRRQIAKLNHRLMAVELENQQQQQREMVTEYCGFEICNNFLFLGINSCSFSILCC